MSKQPRSNVDETTRAVAAFFSEIVSAAPPNASYLDDNREVINVHQWVHFLAHYRVLSPDFTHLHALRVFQRETEGLDNLLDDEGFRTALTKVGIALKEASSMGRVSLDSTNVGTEELASTAAWKKSTEQAALDELVTDINSKRDFAIDQAAHELLGPLYDPEVLRAAYSYGGVLRGLHHHYAITEGGPGHFANVDASISSPSVSSKVGRRPAQRISGRSFYRLCCAVRLVPACLVPGELSDAMAQRCTQGRGRSTSRTAPSHSERQERAAEERFFDEDRMIDGSDDAGWMVPARGFLPGEPRYTFPNLVENLIMLAFMVPPRAFDDDNQELAVIQAWFDADKDHDRRLTKAEFAKMRFNTYKTPQQIDQSWRCLDKKDPGHLMRDEFSALAHASRSKFRVQRLHDIFGTALGLPCGGAPAGGVAEAAAGSSGEEAMEACSVKIFLEDVFVRSGGRMAVPGGQPWDFRDILTRLSEELPQLPERREPYIPRPPPHKELLPQPETIDEKLLRPPGMRNEAMQVTGRKTKGSKKKASKKSKKKLGPVELHKVIYYAKREPPVYPELPARVSERRTKVLEDMRQHLLKQAEQMTAERTGMVAQLADDPAAKAAGAAGQKGAPFTERGGLRLALIDEPLRAPRCRASEEVSTLMETALAARRLRHFEEAVALLLRARGLWAALVAGHSVPPDWAEVQPLVPAPSPWGHGMVSAAVKVSLTEGGRSATGHCSSSCRQPMPGPPERGAAIREGKAVFRRFNTTCAAAHVHVRQRTGATAALAAAVAARADAAAAGGEGDDLVRTILPSELPSERLAGAPQSARGPSILSAGRPGSSGGPRRPSSGGVGSGSPGGGSARGSLAAACGGVGGPSPAPAWALPQASRTPSRPASAASGGSPLISSGAAEVEQLAFGRRYSPQLDFKLALGDDNADLPKLPPEAAIFFFSELASLHAAMGEDELAGQLLWRARTPTERLPVSHPDCAVVWCGLGRTSYLAGAYEVAARCLWRGRKIRERTLGGDTVETATAYNNLACCFFALDRPQEALAHLELAEELLRVLAGEDHPRTQTTLRNLEKARAAPKALHAEVPNLFSFFVPETKMRGRGKKKKGKKKGGSKAGSRASSASSRGRK